MNYEELKESADFVSQDDDFCLELEYKDVFIHIYQDSEASQDDFGYLMDWEVTHCKVGDEGVNATVEAYSIREAVNKALSDMSFYYPEIFR